MFSNAGECTLASSLANIMIFRPAARLDGFDR
jgi:hypothetical protein